MRNVLIALAPLHLASIYLFGWRYLAVLVVVLAVGLLAEWLKARRYNLQVTESLYVSCALFALSLPPAVPLWIAGLGIALGLSLERWCLGASGVMSSTRPLQRVLLSI